MAEQGYLVISDISGYSRYIKESELEHARDSLAALLQLLIDHTRSPFAIAKLEGDAVFSYAPSNAFLQGQSLLEMMEGTYIAFRRALQLMIINTTCPCNACRNLPSLDLKFFVHHGEYLVQEMSSFKELVGADINLLHRLLKNKITEQNGARAYAAYTNVVVEKLNLEIHCQKMIQHKEVFADVGEVELCVQDLHGVWEREREKTRIEVRPEDAFHIVSYDFPIPPAQMWEYVTMPETRALFMGAASQTVEQEDVRKGEQTVYVCVHDVGTSLHTIVDWQPFEQYTTNETLPLPSTAMHSTYRLEPIEQGTRFTMLSGKPRGPLIYRKLAEQGLTRFLTSDKLDKSAAALKERISKDIRGGRLAFMPTTTIAQSQLQDAVAESLVSQ
jgi:uncharacterized protein YndB with AHSA1/START domain